MNRSHSTSGTAKPLSRRIIPAVVLGAVGFALAILLWPGGPESEPPGGSTNADGPPGATATTVPSREANLDPVLGKWFREDGGYRLELTKVEADGRLHAAYFNPNPINVSFARATNDMGSVKLRVELNDVGYPGCFYSLVHDRANDRLIGTYFQAAMGETYEVMFIRIP